MIIRTLAILSALAAVAGPAAAADIKINIVGKDAAVVRAEIAKAARTVCREGLSGLTPLSQFAACLQGVTADAEAQLTAARASYAKAPPVMGVTRISAPK